ncbi:MAG: No significant database matches, partial [uncultured Acetobacteraceae bacterium]
ERRRRGRRARRGRRQRGGPHPRHRGCAGRDPPGAGSDPGGVDAAGGAGAPVSFGRVPAAVGRREGRQPLSFARGSGESLRALPQRAEPGQRDPAARPHHLGGGRRRRWSGAEPRVRAAGRRRRSGALLHPLARGGDGGAWARDLPDARGHPLHPHQGERADAAPAHVRAGAGAPGRPQSLRHGKRAGDPVQPQLHARQRQRTREGL